MSATSSVFAACPNIQDWLDNAYANCSTLRESTPLLSFLLSNENRQPIVDLVTRNNGKALTAELKYMPRLPLSAVESNQAITCTSSNKRGDTTETYTIDPNINEKVDFYIDLQDFIRTCENKDDYLPRLLNNHIDVLVRKVWSKTAQESVLLYGKWASDVTGVTSDILSLRTLETSSTDKYTPQGWVKLKTATAKTGYCAPYVAFTGETFYEYAQVTRLGCCNDNGIDLAKLFNQFGSAVVWDREVKSAFSDENNGLIAQVGALQLLNFSLYDGVNQIDTPQYKRFNIIDPESGLKIDISMKDDCGKIQFELVATTKTIALPNDLYGVGDVYNGVNWVNAIKVNNV